MKMVMIAYNEAIDSEVMELLDRHNVQGFTKWTKVHGKGRQSGPHLMTHVWSKGNNALMCCVSEEQAVTLLDGIRELRQTLGHDGIKGFSMPVSDVT
ncbi:MAG: PG0541 family transporter-associated protein [bacterium]